MTRRTRLIPTAAALALLALLAGLTITRPVQAQDPIEVMFAVEIGVTPNLAGFVIVDGGTDDGILTVACTGNSPQGGPVIPSQVPSDVRASDTSIRVINPIGKPIASPVVLNCVVDALVPTLTAERQLRARYRALAPR
jgi:hypothetical protein